MIGWFSRNFFNVSKLIYTPFHSVNMPSVPHSAVSGKRPDTGLPGRKRLPHTLWLYENQIFFWESSIAHAAIQSRSGFKSSIKPETNCWPLAPCYNINSCFSGNLWDTSNSYQLPSHPVWGHQQLRNLQQAHKNVHYLLQKYKLWRRKKRCKSTHIH